MKALWRSPLFWLLALLIVTAAGAYLLFGAGTERGGRSEIARPIQPTFDQTPAPTPIQPYAALDPALTERLFNDTPLDFVNLNPDGDVPPIGIYLPRIGPEGVIFDLPPATVAPLPSPTPGLFENNTPVAFDSAAVGSIEVEEYAGDGCAPGGLPVSGVLTQRFHRYHSGIDIGVPLGTPIASTHSGEVMFAGWSTYGYGYLVIVQNDIFISYYAHLTNFNVRAGEQVGKSSVIGWSGSTGNSSGPHLHYETRLYDVPVDPLSFDARGYGTC